MSKKEKEIKKNINEEEPKTESDKSLEAEDNNSEDLINRITELESTNAELNDRLLRRIAEFENYKRRTEQDQLNLLKYAAEPFIIKVLHVYDDLKRSLDHASENNSQSLQEGIKLVFDKFTKILQEQGVQKIDCEGQEFDFNLHEALMQQPSDKYPPHTIIHEVEPGYIYKDRVIKHSKVIVSQDIPEASDSDDSNKVDDATK
ncbi:MAG: nucleotide exchange factor GrpE [Melioribacteraceae bacterium]|nr:nucleotide exchange factor GrpE [Melioribacteraceae bacterium]